MRFGLFHTVQWPEGSGQQQQYRNALDQALLAEELGFDAVWMTEHHFTRHGITSDSLMLLTHLAATTQRIRLGTAVAVLPFHDPVRLAESTALLDQLSDGRLDVGIGRGYQWTEYEGFALELADGTDRFEEALAVLLASWNATEPFDFDGRFHQYRAAFPQPRSVQQPHPPVWHATTSAAGLHRCAENEWGVLLAQGTPSAVVERLVHDYRDQLALVGRPESMRRVALARGMYCAPTDAEATKTYLGPYVDFLQLAARVSASPQPAGDAAPRNPVQLDDPEALRETIVCGSPDTCADAIAALADLGIEYLLFFVNLGGMPHEDVMRSLRLFASEVMPRFRS